MSWHAIFVKTGKEDYVCSKIFEALQQSHYFGVYQLLIPKRRVRERHHGVYTEVVKKMFPGYILVETGDIDEIYHHTKRCNNLYRYLKVDSIFQEIKLEEISNILYMTDAEGVIGVSDIFVENDMVQAIAGPLCHFTGQIQRIDRHKQRAKVIFKLNGGNHFIDLSVNFLAKPYDSEIKSVVSFARK